MVGREYAITACLLVVATVSSHDAILPQKRQKRLQLHQYVCASN